VYHSAKTAETIKEVESEGEKKSVLSVKGDFREKDNSGRMIGPKDSTDLFYIGQKVRVTIKEHQAYVAKYPGICIEDEYPKIDGKIVQNRSQRARWASPRYLEKWLSNLAALKPQHSPTAPKAAPKYGDGMYYEQMLHPIIDKFNALPSSERGKPYGNPNMTIGAEESNFDYLTKLRAWKVRDGHTSAVEWCDYELAKLGKVPSSGPKTVVKIETKMGPKVHVTRRRKGSGTELTPITHEEEEQISKRVWAQIMETPKGAAVAAALLGKGPPSTRL
jgi:hypothetical protein